MASQEDKNNQRRREANKFDLAMELLHQEIWVLDDMIPMELFRDEEVRAATHQLEDVGMLLVAVRRQFTRMVNRWIDEDIRDQWPPDDWELPDGTGS